MKPMVFEFQDLASGKAEKKLSQTFSRAGSNVVQSSVGPMKRTSGVSFKDVSLTFADGQAITLSVKQSGDIYAVKLNGKALPIKAQDDHFQAIKEMVKAMDSGRSKFQAALAKAKAALPKGIKSAAPKMADALQKKSADLDAAISEARTKVEELRKELGEEVMDSAGDKLPKADTVLDAVKVAESVLSGAVLDSLDQAKAQLQEALSIVETNYPISVENGDEAQAKLQLDCAESFREALAVLDEANQEEGEDAAEVSEDQGSLFQEETEAA